MRLLSNITSRPTDCVNKSKQRREARRTLISAKVIGDADATAKLNSHPSTLRSEWLVSFSLFEGFFISLYVQASLAKCFSQQAVLMVTTRTGNAAGVATFSVAGHDANSTLGAGLAR